MKGRNRTKSGGDGLHSKVFDTEFETDRKGRFFYFCNALGNLSITENERVYIPSCGFRIHQGLIDDIQVCYKRHCSQLRKIKPTRDSRCSSLYKVYMRKEKDYVR